MREFKPKFVTSTTILVEDKEFLKQNRITVSSAIHAHCDRLRGIEETRQREEKQAKEAEITALKAKLSNLSLKFYSAVGKENYKKIIEEI